MEQIAAASAKLQRSRIKVLAPRAATVKGKEGGFVILSGDGNKTHGQLERAYLSKIAAADFLYVVNVDGYVGQSAATELAYARLVGVPVIVSHKVTRFAAEVPAKDTDLLEKSIVGVLPIGAISRGRIGALLGKVDFVQRGLSQKERKRLGVFTGRLLSELLISQSSTQPQCSTLMGLQLHVARKCSQRGFAQETLSDKFLLLAEQLGKLARASRKLAGIKTDPKSPKFKAEHQAANMLFVLLDICNQMGVDLEGAFNRREQKNERRVWH